MKDIPDAVDVSAYNAQFTTVMRVHPSFEDDGTPTEAMRVQSKYPWPSWWRRWISKTFLGTHWEQIDEGDQT